AKMIHRHPHVFAGETFANLDEQLKAWERLKQEEHKSEGKPTGVFDSLPRSLEPLARAYRIHSKAARHNFTWESTEDVEQQVETEWLEYMDAVSRQDAAGVQHELGDLLFTVVELGRRHGLKANAELDAANERFLSRFRHIEEGAAKAGKPLAEMTLAEMDALWAEAKALEKGEAPASEARPVKSPAAPAASGSGDDAE
ncbi:MAG: MazG nucleotide pyrophosphohydrolase domain-containing protein, partial [Desulfovibrionaceae bacterium]|nr:MazG nucleotide pyrophosphohydrolase domain-containing protein [Desulfovibrionaceae bacterium]